MSIHRNHKCSKQEAIDFKMKVKEFFEENNIHYKSISAFRNYNGEVRIYTGETLQRLRLKMGRRLMAFKNPDGSYEGDSDAINELKEREGHQLWETHADISGHGKISISLTRDDWAFLVLLFVL